MAFRHALFALLPLPRIYRRRVWHPCHTHAALPGGAAVSAAPTLQSSHGIHGTHRNFWQRRASHRFHRCSQMVRLRRVLPRNPRNSQKLLAEKSLPQISQISQMVRLRRVLWEDSLVVAWVWQGCHTLLICAHPLSMLKSKCFDHYF